MQLAMNVIRTYVLSMPKMIDFQKRNYSEKMERIFVFGSGGTDQGGSGEVEREGNRWCPIG